MKNPSWLHLVAAALLALLAGYSIHVAKETTARFESDGRRVLVDLRSKK